jgi:cytidylate kinase
VIIAIDGPAGAGKSTVAKLLAQKLNCTYINTGAMYRAVALKILTIGGKFTEKDLEELIDNTKIQLKGEKVFLDGDDVTEKIKTEKVAKMASKIATIPLVRKKLVEMQRKIAEKEKCVVMEGRDIGTVVFPDADIKIFLTATPEERAKRRYEELKQQGFNIPYEHLLEKIKERDKQDMERKVAPLKPTSEHIVIDTTDKSIDDVLGEIIEIIKSKA